MRKTLFAKLDQRHLGVPFASWQTFCGLPSRYIQGSTVRTNRFASSNRSERAAGCRRQGYAAILIMAVNPLNRRKSTSGRRLSFVFSRRRSETDESASESYHHSAIAGRGISRDESASESYHDHSAGRGISRRLSFVFSRRGSDTDASESYHHSRSNSAGRLPRRSSLRTSISPEASAASDSTAIDPNTQALAVIEADNKKNNFHESLPRSLLAAHADRDCVAPFLRDEVSGYGRYNVFIYAHNILSLTQFLYPLPPLHRFCLDPSSALANFLMCTKCNHFTSKRIFQTPPLQVRRNWIKDVI